MTELPLAEEFPRKTRDDWRTLVDQALKGADFEKRLVNETYDGIKIDPLYTKGDADGPAVHPGKIPAGPWCIAQACALPSPADANAAILEDLEGGATGAALRIAATPDGPGIQIWSLTDLERTLRDVHLEAVPVHLSAGGRALEAAALMIAFTDQTGVPGAARTGTLGLDPIGALAETGTLSASVADHCSAAAEMHDQWAEGSVFSIATQPYHAAGCSEAQELGIALAAGVAYLRGLEAAGMPLDTAARSMRFVLVTDTDIFTTIAKFRAWPALWTRVCAACGLSDAPSGIAAETASRMLTTRDPWVNMLRATAATFAAATGGAESISVAPYSSALGLPDGFARRMARNTQTILQEESHIARVADAAAGSWYVESLTTDLIASAWTVFQSLESSGGMVAALKAGTVQEMIAGVRAKRDGDIAKRKRAVTGVSEFPNIAEAPVAVAEAGARQSAAKRTSVSTWQALLDTASAGSAPSFTGSNGETCTPLPRSRLSEPFETLRDASDKALASQGHRPRVFLANLGTPADFTDRATWARNLFEAGGIEAVASEGLKAAEDAGAVFTGSGASIACLCSSDAVYGERAAEAARQLKAAGASQVFLAGRPGDQETALREAGVDHFAHAGADVLSLLIEIHGHLGLDANGQAAS